jgi:uncharacterized repeat protein (TIGR03847 family)
MDFELSRVDTFTTGAVGPKGQRAFFLQATYGDSTLSLKLEKQQVMAMAEHLSNLLEDLPEIDAQEWTSAPNLLEPIEPMWIVGAMGALYEANDDVIIVMAEEAVEDPDVEEASTATFRMGRAQTLAFIERAHEIVEAGRPPCTWCSRPLNYGEDGFCPCWN